MGETMIQGMIDCPLAYWVWFLVKIPTMKGKSREQSIVLGSGKSRCPKAAWRVSMGWR